MGRKKYAWSITWKRLASKKKSLFISNNSNEENKVVTEGINIEMEKKRKERTNKTEKDIHYIVWLSE